MTWTPERIAIAKREAAAWEGTPYADLMAIKGVGVDCIRLVGELFKAPGIWPADVVFPSYNIRSGIHVPAYLTRKALLECAFCEVVPLTEPATFGDIVIFREGKVSNHCAFYTHDNIIHSLAGFAVVTSPWKQWRHQAECLIRVTQDGAKRRPETLTKLWAGMAD